MHTNSAISMASANGRFVAKVGCAPWIVRPLLRTSGFDPSPERSMQLLRYAIHRAAMGDCRATSEAGRRRSEQWRSWALVGHEAEAYRAAGCASDVRYRISTLFPLTPRLLKVLGANERPSDAAGITRVVLTMDCSILPVLPSHKQVATALCQLHERAAVSSSSRPALYSAGSFFARQEGAVELSM
jgi:hypothetical protein